MNLVVRVLVLILAPVALLQAGEWPEYKNVDVTQVKDGDTVTVMVEAWPDVYVKTDLRIAGVNTPEKRFAMKACLAKYKNKAQCLELSACEKELGYMATDFTKLFVNRGQCSVVGIDPGSTKYAGRINADLVCRGKALSQALIQSGNAREYNGGSRGFWCE